MKTNQGGVMRKFFLGLSVLFLLTSSLSAAEDPLNQPPHSYLSVPFDAKAPAPALILIHEWWGLNEQMRQVADDFATQGYVAYAVDLYEGKATSDTMEAHELMRGLPEDRAMKTLKEALAYLKKNPAVDRERIAVIGWCMGGGYALEFALQEPTLNAAVMYYGKLIMDEKKLMQLKVPLLGIFGGQDRGIAPASVEEFQRDLERFGKSVEIHIYKDAGHAFANPNNANYRAEDAHDAQKKTLVFLKQHLS